MSRELLEILDQIAQRATDAREHVMRGTKLDAALLDIAQLADQGKAITVPPVYTGPPGDLHGPHHPPPAGNTLPS